VQFIDLSCRERSLVVKPQPKKKININSFPDAQGLEQYDSISGSCLILSHTTPCMNIYMAQPESKKAWQSVYDCNMHAGHAYMPCFQTLHAAHNVDSNTSEEDDTCDDQATLAVRPLR
jgi:hypothetical protein